MSTSRPWRSDKIGCVERRIVDPAVRTPRRGFGPCQMPRRGSGPCRTPRRGSGPCRTPRLDPGRVGRRVVDPGHVGRRVVDPGRVGRRVVDPGHVGRRVVERARRGRACPVPDPTPRLAVRPPPVRANSGVRAPFGRVRVAPTVFPQPDGCAASSDPHDGSRSRSVPRERFAGTVLRPCEPEDRSPCSSATQKAT